MNSKDIQIGIHVVLTIERLVANLLSVLVNGGYMEDC